MFSDTNFNQDVYSQDQLMMQSRKRPHDGSTSIGETAKRFDDRPKENCSPELPMITPMFQSTPLVSGQRDFFQPGTVPTTQTVSFYPNCFSMQPLHPYVEQNSVSSDSGVLSDDSNLQHETVFETPKPFQSEQKPTRSINPLEVFDEAPGRLCLLNASTKYKVTLSEINRRMSHPETLHASLINGVLRKLAEKGFSLPSGRRKTAPTTAFTALCEKEALVMARDFSNLCTSSLNTFEIARHANRLQYSPQELVIIRRYLAGIMAIFDEVPEDPEDYMEKNSATHSINILSMLTHGFGHNALKTALRVFGKIVDHQHALLQGAHAPPFMPYHMQHFI